jgi:hypothetical protein
MKIFTLLWLSLPAGLHQSDPRSLNGHGLTGEVAQFGSVADNGVQFRLFSRRCLRVMAKQHHQKGKGDHM